MMGAFEVANKLAILAGGRKPQWIAQASYTGAPASASAGNYVQNSLLTVLAISLREEAHRRTARVSIAALDLAAVYTVTIDGTAIAYDAGAGGAADAEDVLLGIAAAITADGVAGLIVSAVATDTDGDSIADIVLIRGLGEDDYLIDIAATGAGELAAVADPSTGTLRAWVTFREEGAPAAWLQPMEAEYPLTRRGFCDRFDTGSIDRLYAEIADLTAAGDGGSITYAVTVSVGPCVQE